MRMAWMLSAGALGRADLAHANCYLGFSLNPFYSRMDALIAMNEGAVESFADRIAEGGALIVNTSMVADRAFRKDVRVVRVAATELSQQLKNPRGANIIMLGAAVEATGLFPAEQFADGIDGYFQRKGKNNPLNRECFMQGVLAARKAREASWI